MLLTSWPGHPWKIDFHMLTRHQVVRVGIAICQNGEWPSDFSVTTSKKKKKVKYPVVETHLTHEGMIHAVQLESPWKCWGKGGFSEMCFLLLASVKTSFVVLFFPFSFFSPKSSRSELQQASKHVIFSVRKLYFGQTLKKHFSLIFNIVLLWWIKKWACTDPKFECWHFCSSKPIFLKGTIKKKRLRFLWTSWFCCLCSFFFFC